MEQKTKKKKEKRTDRKRGRYCVKNAFCNLLPLIFLARQSLPQKKLHFCGLWIIIFMTIAFVLFPLFMSSRALRQRFQRKIEKVFKSLQFAC